MNEITIRDEIVQVNPDIAADEVFFSLWNMIKFKKQELAELERMLDDKAIECIKSRGRDLVCGDLRAYVGQQKDTKCVDPKATLMEFLGMDLDIAAGCLSSNAWKPGACRAALPPSSFDRLFKTETKDVVKEGKATKQLIKVNQHFMR